MSLDKPKGNPNWVGRGGNPNGRPVGAKSLKSLLKVAATLADKKRHPVEELIRIADKAEQAGAHVVITKPGSTTWKIGDVVLRSELQQINSMMKTGEHAEAKVLPTAGVGVELAAKIWADLLKYCEPQKKAVESAPEKPITPDDSIENAEKLLKEMEAIGNAGTNTHPISSNQTGLDNGTPGVSTEANSEDHLSSDQGK
jgi:hypothetical protein